jgi:hypothetical protein
LCWRGYATVNLLSDSSHEQTIDTEDKRDARALTELNEAAAVTQARLSDVSFKGGVKLGVCGTLAADVRGENDSSGKMDMLALERRRRAAGMTTMDGCDPCVGRCESWSLCDASRGFATGELDGETTDAAMAAVRTEATAERIEESVAARRVVEKEGDVSDRPGKAGGAASPVLMESAGFGLVLLARGVFVLGAVCHRVLDCGSTSDPGEGPFG